MVSTRTRTTSEDAAGDGTPADPAAAATGEKAAPDSDKHYDGHEPPIISTGNAKTFGEYDQFAAARDVEDAVDGEVGVFNALIDNIRFDFELTAAEKAKAIEALAASLPARIDDARTSGTIPDHLHIPEGTGGAIEMTIGAAKDDAPIAVTNDPGSVSVFKDANGRWRWIAVHSNRYQDREKEIFSAESHKAWADYVYETGAFPALRLWHIPADFGRADFVDYDDKGFVVSSGVFADGADDIAEALSRRKDIGCSHGFRFDPRDLDENGVYHRYRTFEISVLPSRSAANQLTAFSAGREIPMMTEERKAFLLDVAGPERVEALETALGEMSAYAKEKGLSYKDLSDTLFPDLASKDVGDGTPVETEAGDGDTAGEATAPPAADPPAADPPAAPESGDAAEEEGSAEEHESPSTAETPSAEDQADAAKSFAKAMGGDDAVVAMVRLFAPAIREAAAEAMENATAPIVEKIAAMGTEVEGLKGLSAIVGELTKDRDTMIAEAIRPRSMPPASGFSAADSAETAIDSDAAGDVAAQKAGAEGDEDDTKDMTEARRAANPYVLDALHHMAQVPGVEHLAPPVEAAG